MNILVFVLAMIMAMTILTYNRYEGFIEFIELRKEYRYHMQNREFKYTNTQQGKKYANSNKGKKYANSNKGKKGKSGKEGKEESFVEKSKEQQEYEENLEKVEKRLNRYFNIYSLVTSDDFLESRDFYFLVGFI